ncbi:MAG TPA: DUF6282 family protein [Caulobacteraceae bacterium]|jgi:hypothetical protein
MACEKRRSRWSCVAALALLTASIGGGLAAPASAQSTAAEEAALIKGAIDFQVHSYPDDRPRSIDALGVAQLAAKRGMAAIVLKNHYEPTAGIAYVVQSAVPGVKVFGGIVLNRPQGGINPAAVEHMANLKGGQGKVVWMPTLDAENDVRFHKENRPTVPVVRGGELLPEVKQVIGIIAKNDLVLETGHLAPEEGLMVLREGKRQGVKHMMVTHPMFMPVFMNVAQMKEAAALGAYLELTGGAPNGRGGAERMKAFADTIRAVGVEHCVLATDLGQPNNPLPPDGMAEFLVALKAQGFTTRELDIMAKDNPARLLGLIN